MTSTRRRSGRQVKYKEQSSEDEEDEDPKVKSAKKKLKELVNQDSDEDSDFEQEIKKKDIQETENSSDEEVGEMENEEAEEEGDIVGKIQGKGRMFDNKMKNGVKKSIEKEKCGISVSIQNGKKENLNLSDSESSSDEESKEIRKKKNINLGAPRTDWRTSSFEEEATDEDDQQSSQTLIALAQNLTQINNTWKDGGKIKEEIKEEIDVKPLITPIKTPQERKGKSRKKEEKGKSSISSLNDTNLDSISKLLAKGEKLSDVSGEEEEPDLDVKEEVKSSVPSQGIEVTISLPDKARRKKKQFDVAAFLKRELSKARRETQALMHQSHFVCLVSHLRYLNSVISEETFRGAALSLVPAAHAHKPNNVTLTSLAATVRWLRDFIPVSKISTQKSFLPFRRRLLKVFESYLAMDLMELVCVFVIICRAIGLDTRIVFNLDVVPLKPPNDDQKSSKDKAKKESPETKSKETKKKPLKGSDSEGDELELHKGDSSRKSLSSKLAEKKGKSSSSSCSKSSSNSSKTAASNSSKTAGSSSNSKRKSDIAASSRDSSSSKSSGSKRKSEPPPPLKDAMSSSKSSSKRKSEPSSSREPDKDKVKRRACRATLELPNKSAEDREDEMIKKICEKYPTKEENKADLSKDKKRESRKRKSSVSSSDEEFEPEPENKSRGGRSKSQGSRRRSSSQDSGGKGKKQEAKKRKSSGEEFEAEKPTSAKSSSSRPSTSRASTSNIKKSQPDRCINYWAEVYLEKDKKWVSVDLENGRINSPSEIESKLQKPIFYILAADSKGYVKDVTRRYTSEYMTTTRKLRYDEDWILETLKKYAQRSNNKTKLEDQELTRKSEECPMPTTVSGFKNHPLYVLKRHLLKFEAIYPPEAPSLGFIRGEPIYARECVQTLQGRTSWLKEGRVVKIGEDPYNIVTARPKYDRMTGTVIKDQPLEVFGHWQTEKYIPPPAKDGKVPRNEYGNVELFKPWMLPKGTVHIPINGLQRVLRKLNIDAAPAMMGWDFSGGGCHPVFDGYVVCQEFEDLVIDAWNQDQREKEERAEEKREKRVLDNWRRLIKGLFIREKIQAKYMKKK